MEREEVRKHLHEYFKIVGNVELSDGLARDMVTYLKLKYPNRRFGNTYVIEGSFHSFFPKEHIEGCVKRMDPIEQNHVVDFIKFEIFGPDEIAVWGEDPVVLDLDLDHLSKDDLVDIKYLDLPSGRIDVINTFMRIPPKKRGLLAGMMENPLAAFRHHVPPYAFYNYQGQFYHTTNKTFGDIGGGYGFGGFIRELGSTLEIDSSVKIIDEHAFDSCANLKEVIIKGKPHHIGKLAFSNTSGLVIRCRFDEKPGDWDEEWCDANCKVIWNYIPNGPLSALFK